MDNQLDDQAPVVDNTIAGRLGRVFQYIGAIITEVNALVHDSGLMQKHAGRDIRAEVYDDQVIQDESAVSSDERFS